MRRTLYAFVAALIASAAIATGGGAFASTTPVQPILTSQYLGGHIAVGVHELGDIRVVLNNLPNLAGSSCAENPSLTPCIANDSVVQGDVLSPSTNGGSTEYGIGAVWNDVSGSTCGAGFYAVEAGFGVPIGPALPLSPSSLHPVLAFGSDICLAPGGSEAVETYYSTSHHLINFEAGPSIAAEQVVSTVPHVFGEFFAAGRGIDVTSGTIAGALPDGVVANFGSSGLTELSDNHQGAHQTRITFAAGAIYEVEGTVNGGPVTPSNVLTMTPGFSGPASAGFISVP